MALLLAMTVAEALAAERPYPTRPVRIVVSNATGSSPEITGRIVANRLSAQMGQQFVIDTRPGASGIIGVETVKNAAPDGYTLLVGSTTVFAGHVPYKGAAQVLADLVAGHIQCQFTSPVVAMPQAKSGRVRVIATTGTGPDPLVPELPTVASTVPGYESTQWFGIALPARTPKPIVDRLHAEIMRVLRSPEIVELLSKQGATAQPESPAAFAKYIRDERTRIAGLAKSAGIRID